MDGGFFTCGNNLFLGSVQFGDADIVFNAVVEQVGFLGYKSFPFPQVGGVDLVYLLAGYSDFPCCTFQNRIINFNRVDFPLPLFPTMPVTWCCRNLQVQVGQNRFIPIRERNLFYLCTLEVDFLFSSNFFHDRGFIQNIQYTVAGCESIL